ncbi:MAG TPA: ATP-binding protein [Terriglobales bacterium]|jgi:two-component system sensor histidine kinase CpxA|nr:ATP-binding protein [Terriglobales bacterium]
MRSLFVKIFLSYWMAQALFLVLAILVTVALRPTREMATVEALAPGFLNDAVQAYRNGGAEGAHRYLRSLHDSQHLHFFVFDGQGNDLSGRKPPEWIEQVRRGEKRTADSFWGRFGPRQFLRQSMTTPDGQSYTLVIELPPEGRAFFGPRGVPGLGILIAVVSSGLVCYFLARYLTAPVVRLRAATQRLAAGDLTARAGGSPAGGHDEIAELVRDFDAMAERLENLVNAQGRLLKDISHELRSPLARLNVALGLVRQRSGPEAQSTLDRIELEAERLNELIGRLLTIARLEGGADALDAIPVDLGELVAEVAADADFEAQNRRCHVECVIADDCVVRGDPSLLRSAIENVVRNATRYTQEGTNVHVHVECGPSPRGAEAIIRVTDSGPGVPEEALDKLFRPFYRIDDARGRQTGGVGLGLAITERAVRLHGGTVRAANRPEGGLMVEIRLPAEPAPTRETVPLSGIGQRS